MSPLLTNYNFLSPLKRNRAVRNRSNNPTASPSKCANRLPVLPELSGEQDTPSCSSSISSSTPSSCSTSSARLCRRDAILPSSPSVTSSGGSSRSAPSARSCRSEASTSASSTSSKSRSSEKRRSRYGRDEFALDPNFLRAAAVDTPTKQKRQSVCLSAYDIIIDITRPPSPVSDSPPPAESNTLTTPPRPSRPRNLRHMSPPRSRSPTPSLTSMSACSSNDIPTTPLTSDDEWPGLSPPQLRKAPAAQPVKIHPFVITTTKSTTAPLGPTSSSANVFEFTLVDPDEERTEEDEVSWYARELSQVVSIATPSSSSSSSATGTRPDSLFPPPRSARNRMSKPLPSVPRARGPHPQLDPTFPRPRTATAPTPSRPPRQPLPPTPSGTTPTTAAVRKSLKITVPRAPPRTPLPLDVADIFDDPDAWSIFVPSTGRSTANAATSASTTALSPPRLPQTPMSVYDEYDPVELIVDYATQPSPLPSSFLPSYESDDEEYWPTEEKLRSRWSSCSTIAPPASPSASEKLRFHLGSVARRVRARRTGAGAGEVVVPKSHTHSRCSSEPSVNPGLDAEDAGVVGAGVRSESGHEEAEPESCLRRKPIPLELFLRR